ncbi:MAG: sigma-70 family RNA polymerase sigma factor [Candidatus Limiplasma sp.]|nr:sigma-70 family RNA polymerase sigma factor [Candidatus Limiplasma sp.]
MSTVPRDEAIVDLYKRYYKIVYNQCLVKLHFDSRFVHLVEDCVQETFVLFLISYDKLCNHPNPAGWLCSTAWNRLRSEVRKANYRSKKLYEIAELEKVSLPEVEAALERWANQEIAIETIAAICSLLTQKEQEIYQAYFVEDLSLAETASKSGASPNSVRSAIGRIKKRAKQFENFLLFLCIFECILHISRTK